MFPNVEQTFHLPEEEEEDICVGDFDDFLVRSEGASVLEHVYKRRSIIRVGRAG